MSIFSMILLIVCAVLGWFLLGQIWKRIIKPFFKNQVRTIRTSIIGDEQTRANQLDNNECCICLAEPKIFRVVVTCGHSYCAQCIFKIYNKHNNEQIQCPYCRSKIISIFKAFSETQPVDKIEDIRSRIRDYNSKFGDDRSIKRTIQELPFILTKIIDYIFSADFLLFFIKQTVFLKGALFIIIYFMLPFDFMPSSVFGILGYIDNLAVILAVSLFAIGRIGLIYLNRQQ